MTFIHGKDTVVNVDGVDLSAFMKTTEWTDTSDIHDVTTYGNDRKRKKAGLGDGTVTNTGVYDDGAAGPRTILQAIKDAGDVVPYIWQPEGAGAGKAQSTVGVVISSLQFSDPVDDMIAFTVEFDMDGTLSNVDQ